MAQNYTSFARGVPLDVTTLGKMSQELIDIRQELLANRQSKSMLYSVTTDTYKQMDTADVTIWTGRILIVGDSVPNPEAKHENWSASFTDVTFNTIPVVTATPFCDTDTGTGPGTIAPSAIWIHNITTTGVRGKWKWLGKTTKHEAVYALIIAIGEGQVG